MALLLQNVGFFHILSSNYVLSHHFVSLIVQASSLHQLNLFDSSNSFIDVYVSIFFTDESLLHIG